MQRTGNENVFVVETLAKLVPEIQGCRDVATVSTQVAQTIQKSNCTAESCELPNSRRSRGGARYERIYVLVKTPTPTELGWDRRLPWWNLLAVVRSLQPGI